MACLPEATFALLRTSAWVGSRLDHAIYSARVEVPVPPARTDGHVAALPLGTRIKFDDGGEG